MGLNKADKRGAESNQRQALQLFRDVQPVEHDETKAFPVQAELRWQCLRQNVEEVYRQRRNSGDEDHEEGRAHADASVDV